MRVCKFVLLSLLALSVFSCKANIADVENTTDDSAVSDNLFNLNEYRSPKEEYLSTRTLRDELVEDVIFGQYRADDHYIDKALVTLVLGEDADLSTPVYKKNQQTLLTYTLPSYRVDESFQTVELDSEYTEDIIVKSFDFNIEGKTGFVVVSNDDRLGIILSFSRDREINRNEIKRAVIEKVNAQIDTIKREWSTITSGDVHSVLERGWGFSKQQAARGKNFADILCTFNHVRSQAGFSTLSGLMKDYVDYNTFKEKIVGVEDEWSKTYEEFLEVLLHNLTRLEGRSYYDYESGRLVYVSEIIKDFEFDRGEQAERERRDFIDEKLAWKNKHLLDLADKINKLSSVQNDYSRLRGSLICLSYPDNLYRSIDPMLKSEKPLLAYSYYNVETGVKMQINNVWRYIKNLKKGSDLSPLTERILKHLVYGLRGGYNRDYISNLDLNGAYYNSYNSSRDNQCMGIVFKGLTHVDENGNKVDGRAFLRDIIKEKYGIDIGLIKYYNLDGGVKYPKVEYGFSPFLKDCGQFDINDSYHLTLSKKAEEKYSIATDFASKLSSGKYIYYMKNQDSLYIGRAYYYLEEHKVKFMGIFKMAPKISLGGKLYFYDYFSGNERDAFDSYFIEVKAKETDTPAIKLPYSSREGKTLIDVYKDGKFELAIEEDVFKPRMKQATVGKDASANKNDAGSSNTSGKGANSATSTTKSSNTEPKTDSITVTNKGVETTMTFAEGSRSNESAIALPPPKKLCGKPKNTLARPAAPANTEIGVMKKV